MRELDGASANFTGLVIGCIEPKFCKAMQATIRWKALAEIYTMHSFAPFSKLKFLFEIAKLFAICLKILFAKFC